MNLLHVISSMNPLTGGPCQVIINLADELTQRGIEQEIVCLDDPEATYVRQCSLIVNALGVPQSSWQYSSQLAAWLQANMGRYDVLVLHGLWLYLGFAVWKVLQAFKKESLERNELKRIPKFFIIPHGMLDPWFQKDARRRFKAIRNIFYWHFIEHRIINSADGLLFTCETELLLAKEPFRFYKPKREINVGYGIVEPPRCSLLIIEAFYNRFPHLRHKRYFLFLGRIHSKKGVDLLIRAYENLLVANVPSIGEIPKLVIAGPGRESPYGRSVQQQVMNSALLRENVTFTDMVVDQEKWGAFYNAEAFILPSYQENFGIAVVEALACGKAVLISDQVNIWREIANHNAGFVFPNSIDAIKLAMLNFLALSKEEKDKMSWAASTTYKKVFSAGPVAKRFAEAISV